MWQPSVEGSESERVESRHLGPNPAPSPRHLPKHNLSAGGHPFASLIEQLNFTFLYHLVDGTLALPHARQAQYH